MAGIFGLVALDGRPLGPGAIGPMRAALAPWEPGGGGVWADGAAALGCGPLDDIPESVLERMPRWSEASGLAFAARGRLDNRGELFEALGVPGPDRVGMPDGDLMLRAFLRWGEDAPPRLFGDWSFAAWRPAYRRLVLARDHHGNTALYVWRNAATVAFASSLRAILALPGVPAGINELRLAQVLVSWAGDGVETAYEGIERVPPAHLLVIAPGREERRRFWFPESVGEQRRRGPADYAEGLRDVLEEAVRCRLRSGRPVATMLSGGLDSGSVASLAARALAASGGRLTAFCAVPRFPDQVATGPFRFGDESDWARATVRHAGNIDLTLVDSAHVSPVASLRRGLEILGEPQHAASNLYSIFDLLDSARGEGAGALLTGQMGNGTISWKGRTWIRPGRAAEDRRDWRRRLRYQVVLPLMPEWVVAHLARRPLLRRTWEGTAINGEFARRLRLGERWADEALNGSGLALQLRRDARRARLGVIQPGRSIVGAFWSQAGDATGLDVRDPTADVRVIEYCLSVPNREYTGPGGADRWLIRRAMRGIVPEDVLATERRGLQAADIGARLAAESAEVDRAIESLGQVPAAQTYLDLESIRTAWQVIRTQPASLAAYAAAVTVLLRGLMAGLFVASVARAADVDARSPDVSDRPVKP